MGDPARTTSTDNENLPTESSSDLATGTFILAWRLLGIKGTKSNCINSKNGRNELAGCAPLIRQRSFNVGVHEAHLHCFILWSQFCYLLPKFKTISFAHLRLYKLELGSIIDYSGKLGWLLLLTAGNPLSKFDIF